VGVVVREAAMLFGLLALLAFSSSGALGASQANGVKFRLLAAPGRYAVGLKVVHQYDQSRTFRNAVDDSGADYDGERARPVQTLVWYPALEPSRAHLRVRDYTNFSRTEVDPLGNRLPAKIRDFVAAMGAGLDDELRASFGARAVEGRFPVVIYAPGASSPAWENADLCEYLASHGYVVIASPSLGVSTRDMDISLDGINAQAADISFLIGFAVTLADTDMQRIAVVGHSWGGISNLFAASRDSRIDALVALDGSLRYYPGLVRRSSSVAPERLGIPLLAFVQGDYSLENWDAGVLEEQRAGPNVLNSWTHGDLIIAHMLSVAHAAFSTKWQRSTDYWNYFTELLPGDFGPQEAMVGYGWMARYTLEFLNAYLRQDRDAGEFLRASPRQNGVPGHIMTVRFREAVGSPLTFDTFRREVGRRKFIEIATVYRDFRAQDATFILQQPALIAWGDALLDAGHSLESIGILSFAIELYPACSACYYGLGLAYEATGNMAEAIGSYEASLRHFDASNGTVRRKLHDLRQISPQTRQSR
jgi:dienelactone hydrolase